MNPGILISFISLLAFSLPAYSGSEASLDLPPDSLKQWYKPGNKRQVWLHTMFKLRRAMQAIEEYTKAGDYSSLPKWLSRLDKHYRQLAVMVPEWKDRVKPELMAELIFFTREQDTDNINRTLNSLRRTCNNCHADFQPLVTALYRTPDYDDIEIIDNAGHKKSLDDNMNAMSSSVNQLLIALDDNRKSIALKAYDDLASQFDSLGQSCQSCHKDDPYPVERILGQSTQQQMQLLKTNIQNDKVKDSQRLMGQIAVNVCSRCHNIHRTLYGIRKAILNEH